MRRRKEREISILFVVLLLFFAVFLILPLLSVFYKSFLASAGGFTLGNYSQVLLGRDFLKILGNSLAVSSLSALITTGLAFFLAVTLHYTNVHPVFKQGVRRLTMLPMLLPTITYGFAIIYSFGRQGLLTRLFGRQLFDIYGLNGLLLGYIIYTLPISFMLIYNTIEYIDKKFMIVSGLMGDRPIRTFYMTIVCPLAGTLAASFIQAFFLSFTDFGIPASVGGEYEVIAGVLYSQMLGSVPDFGKGAVVALVMLVPSVISITVLHLLEKKNVRYSKVSPVELRRNPFRDWSCGLVSALILVCLLSVFAVMIVVPFVKEWPYRISFTLEHFQSIAADGALINVYRNSLVTALLTALIGTIAAYGAALVTARSQAGNKIKKTIESAALVTNTIPGMVLGLAYLFCFSGSSLQNTLMIIIVCNVVHFFSTPYLLVKNALQKMNASWENTASLLGDSWLRTITRIITPNVMPTLLEAFGYYFVNAMVTVSALIFITGTRTMVLTTKIKELQYFNKYSQIFVLSLLILATNAVSKLVFKKLTDINHKKVRITKMAKKNLTKTAVLMSVVLGLSGLMSGCGTTAKAQDKVIMYTNADEEAVAAMEHALDQNGFQDQYVIQTFGTAELGGKILAEGTDMEADLMTMSTFYVDSAQQRNQMFKPLEFEVKTLAESSEYCAPITAQEGTIIVNTEMLKEHQLPAPTSLKDLVKPEYKGFISVTDVNSSSTAWLMIQGLIEEYGEDGAKEILQGIYQNAGAHIEDSGSAPLKKARAGEVAVGFGLRQQAAADKAEGLPIDFVDPAEGNFTLTESVAVIDKGDKSDLRAMEMAQCIIENAREELQSHYPIALYEGEATDAANLSEKSRVFSEPLTVELLEKHQQLSDQCR